MDKLQSVMKELAAEKEDKLKLIKQKREVDKEIAYQKEGEDKIIKKLKASVPMEDYNRLRRELEQEQDKY